MREIEKRIHKSDRFGETPDPAIETPAGIPVQRFALIRVHWRLVVPYPLLFVIFATFCKKLGPFPLQLGIRSLVPLWNLEAGNW